MKIEVFFETGKALPKSITDAPGPESLGRKCVVAVLKKCRAIFARDSARLGEEGSGLAIEYLYW